MSVIYQPSPGNKLTNDGGFTLLELMIVVSIAAILLGIAIPSFKATIRNNRLTAYANGLVTALNVARSEAVKRGRSVTVRKVDDKSSTNLDAAANWEDGWDVFTDADGDGEFETGDADILIGTYPALNSFYTLRGDGNFADYISYGASGRSHASGIFVICDDSDGLATPAANTSRLIMVNTVGRVSMGIDTDNTQIPENGGADLATCTPP
jgi:type IV fimbrial biogenesis protein FimT